LNRPLHHVEIRQIRLFAATLNEIETDYPRSGSFVINPLEDRCVMTRHQSLFNSGLVVHRSTWQFKWGGSKGRQTAPTSRYFAKGAFDRTLGSVGSVFEMTFKGFPDPITCYKEEATQERPLPLTLGQTNRFVHRQSDCGMGYKHPTGYKRPFRR
jgi:hypothetical protein